VHFSSKIWCTIHLLFTQPSDPSLVPFAAEEGKIYISLTKKLVKEHLYSLQRKKIDTVILGSTHYPFLKKKL